MRLRVATWIVASLLAARPAAAQSLYGEGDWMLYRAHTTFGGTRGFTKIFTQSYTVGYESILWDPRLGDYVAELTFLRSDITNNDLDGDSRNLGYNLGANLFPNRPFPFSISATRTAGDTSPQFPGFDFATGGAGGVALPPGYVPDRYSTRLSTLDVNWQLLLPDWPRFHVNYRKDSGLTATGPYEGTEKNDFLNLGLEKEWRGSRNQLTYTDYSGESRSSFPLDRSQKELLYNLSADLTSKLRADGRAGFRDISSTFTLSAGPSTPGGQVPPVLSNDLTSYYSSGGLTYQQSERLGFDALVGYEALQFDRDGRPASSDSMYTVGGVRYRLVDSLNIGGNANSSRRSETLDGVTREGTQRGVGASFSYAPTLGFVHPVLAAGRSVGRIATVDGETGDTGGWTRQAGLSATPGRWFTAGVDYLDAESTDDIFVLNNFTRRRWQANASSRPVDRLRLDATWERTNLDQGLGAERLQSDYRLGQGGATWDLSRLQSVGARVGTWRTESGVTAVDTVYAVAAYRGVFGAMRLQGELVRDSVRTHMLVTGETPDRILYRVQGLVEYRLRLFTLGFNYRYSNNVETGLARYLNNEWSIRIGRRFGAAFAR